MHKKLCMAISKLLINFICVFPIYLMTFLQLNVLIDDGGNALLCDFGLSRIRADVTSRTATPNARGTAGSRNWMAPELLLGGTPKKPSDIYAFAMTTYEVGIIFDARYISKNLDILLH